MTKRRNRFFSTAIAIFVSLVFFFNGEHINQQGTYQNIFKPIAENILSNGQYTCAELGNEPLLYPLWGYTFLTTLNLKITNSDFVLLLLQYFLCIAGISLFYKIFRIEPRYWHIPLHLPFIAMMSVKWPDAIAGFLLLLFVYFALKAIKSDRTSDFIMSGIILGIILNFRSEYIYLPLFIIFFSIFPIFKNNRKNVIKLSLISCIFSMIVLLPWVIRSERISDEYRFSATNGGAVMYISLGQLPENKWNISPYDKTAYDIADSLGFSSPYSPEANDYFYEKAESLILEEPGEFAKKAGYNFMSAWIKGVYTGEYANFFIRQLRRNEIDSGITNKSGMQDKFMSIFELNSMERIPILIEKGIQGVFIPIVFVFMFIFFLSIFKVRDSYLKIVIMIAAVVIIYKLALISLIQYEYRHVNSIYPLVFGVVLVYFKSRKQKTHNE